MKNEEWKTFLPYVIACIALGIGTFYDYQLTHALYQSMPLVSSFFERLMLIPLLSVVAITLVVEAIVKKSKPYLGVAYFACLYVVYDAMQYWFYEINVWMILTLFVLAGAYLFIIYVLTKNISPYQLEKRLPFLQFFSKTLITSLFISVVIKYFWGRIRYRDLLHVSDYTPWYVINGVNGNYSFPSGHTTCFTTILCLLEYKENRFMNSSVFKQVVIWGLIILMPIARMMAGAHYLSDTAVGFMITYSCYLYYRYQYRKRGLL